MEIKLIKRLAWFWLIFACSPLLVWYFTHLFPGAVWLWSWIPLWAWFVHSKRDELDRGLVFLVGSALIATIGKSLIGTAEHQEVVDMIYQLLLLIGGGVGGNFMAYWLVEQRKHAS